MLVEVELDEGRGPVVVKRPTDATDSNRLRTEAAALAAARHPGVVRVVDRGDSSGPAGPLRLRWAGPHTLATTGPMKPPLVAAILASVAATVADLHERGLVHNRLTADHVVLGTDGTPVLCGLREAGAARAHPRSDDVASIGRLIEHLLGPSDAEFEPIPERRRLWARPHWDGYQRRALLLLADQATAEEVTARPTARGLSESLSAHAEAPSSRLARLRPWRSHRTSIGSGPPVRRVPGEPGSTSAPPVPGTARGTWPDRPALEAASARSGWAGLADRLGSPRTLVREQPAFLMLGIAVVLLVLGSVVVDLPPSDDTAGPISAKDPSVPVTRPAPAMRTTIASAPDTTIARTTDPVTASLPVRICPAATEPAADIDGDGCPEPFDVADGQVTIGSVSYRIGRVDDQILVDNWRCSGRATAALLRPSTGEVFVFDRWATASEPLTIGAAAVVTDAVALHAVNGPGGCPSLTVERRIGLPVTVSAKVTR